MQPEIYHGKAWLVETYNGTEVVPDDLVSLPDSLDGDEMLCEGIKQLQPFCEGAIIEVPDYPISGWLVRLTMPGYLDCTEWSLFETEQEAIDWAKNLMGEDC